MSEVVSEEVPKLSEKLKQAREDQGWTLETVAEKLNLSVEQIAKLESMNTDLADLTPFERGYIRNYASLLEVSIEEFESEFPSGTVVGSDLQSVERYSYKVSKPIMSRSWVKMVFYIVIFVVVAWVVSVLDLSLSDFTETQQSETASEILLPSIDEVQTPQKDSQ